MRQSTKQRGCALPYPEIPVLNGVRQSTYRSKEGSAHLLARARGFFFQNLCEAFLNHLFQC